MKEYIKKYKGLIFIFLAALCFSTQEISGVYLNDAKLNAMQINSVTYFIGALVLLPLGIREIRKSHLKLTRKDILFFGFLGIIQVAVGMTFSQQALIYANPSIVAVIVAGNAILTIPLAQLILKEKMNPKAWIAIAVAAVGVIIISDPFTLTSKVYLHQALGICFALICCVTNAIFNVYATKSTRKYGKSVICTFSFFWGSIVLFIIMGLSGVPIIRGINLSNLPILIYMGVVVKGIAFFFFIGAMKETSASMTATGIFYVKPVIVPILVLLIMGTLIPLTTLIGIAVILFASVLLYLIKKSAAKRHEYYNI